MRAWSRLPFMLSVMLLAGCGGGGGGGGASTGAAAGGQAPAPVVNASADLHVTSPAFAGDFFSGAIATYTLTVSNAGPDTARDVTIETATSPGQSLSSITCVAVAASCPASVGPVMMVPALPNGGSLAFTVNASIDIKATGSIGAALRASAAGDQSQGNNIATSFATTRIPTSPQSPSFIALQSDYGDFIGEGRMYYYDRSVAQIQITVNGNFVTLRIQGDESWTGNFKLPQSQTTLSSGNYLNLRRYPFHDPAIGGLSWNGENRDCNQLSGSFTVDAVTFVSGALATVDLSFEQHCENRAPALRGQIHWNSSDGTRPPGPVNPPPDGLWEPPAGATPVSGNYIYLQSDVTDWVARGHVRTHTQANALLNLTPTANQLLVDVFGDIEWHGTFQAMSVLPTLEPGYYGDLHRYPFHNTARGGLSWWTPGASCNKLNGWFVIDSITYSGGSLASIDLRFEQRCIDAPEWNGVLHGKIHWDSSDPVNPAGPQNPPPAGLWSAPAGATPATGNYVYLQSDAGDLMGRGRTYAYTQANSLMSVSTTGARLRVTIDGDESWVASFQAMNTLPQLVPGYYGNVGEYPFHNPTLGGQSWEGEGRACTASSGWFVVDDISYAAGALAAIDLRFELHCEYASPALRGEIHWAAGDPTQPPGPQNPPPADLWAPPPGATPATGNYVYLSSSPGDPIGQGRTYTYTAADATVGISLWTTQLTVSVRGVETWTGQFGGMEMQQWLEQGYYGNLQRYPMHNPVRGGLSWIGGGRGCTDVTGWFAVDNLVHASGNVESLDLRFEQSCDGQPPLRGQIHWIR